MAIWVHFLQTLQLPWLSLYQYNHLCLVFCFVGGDYVLVLVSIIFWKFVVSMKLLILPFASGIIGSSGENLHSPSTMNLYLNRLEFTDEDHAGVALLTHFYDCDHKLVTLLL